ncbi:MAG: heavy metal translocating P-type ATPase [Gemmatimonadaceae bacterium]|nr:heavy metal translocating P-type ATPase [Gloeobacterales cyanobacterium ES-bin-141]
MKKALVWTSTLSSLVETPGAVAAFLCALLVWVGWWALSLGLVIPALSVLAVAYIVGGFESAREGLTTLWQERDLDVDLLMIVAALGAAALGVWRGEYYFVIDGAVLILIFAVSGAIEGYAMQRTGRDIEGLMGQVPDIAHVVVGGTERTVPIRELCPGDEVRVRPGELVPVDGRIVEGHSELDQAPLTGESVPVEKTVGEEVYAGSINGNGALRLKVERPPESSLIRRIVQLVEEAQTEAPPSQRFIERFERGYARVIVAVGVLLATLPALFWGWTWEDTIYRALIFLVVASPCALMAAIMPTLLSGIARGARDGILFKNGAQLEEIGRLRAIAFDKTGTLTLGKPRVCEVRSVAGDREVLEAASALEAVSEHPLGRAIVEYARGNGLAWPAATDVQAVAGRGIRGWLAGEVTVVGRPTFVCEHTGDDATWLREWSERLEAEGRTVVWVARGGQLLGAIAAADTVRAGATEAIAGLRALGIEHIVMLTGDNEKTARRIALEVGVDEVYANLLPEDKLRVIRELQERYTHVAMVGDGINDAPALAQASVGIAMGGAGTDMALETADVVLMADRLEKLELAVRLGRRSQAVVRQNIAFALGCVGALLVTNFVGDLTLPLGVIGHEGSTVLVTLSGLRLLRG